ncbi:MAG: GxxExxY protein [Salinivirgaceae bacterium]|jgi:GxxExxY protein|nr:GxxExxY protein [Salinivirgaceae bacterium]
MSYSEQKYPLQDETYKTIGLCMEIHRTFGNGLLEIVYKDALEHEFNLNKIPFEREKKYEIEYKGIMLPHHFYADFVVDEKIILEIKASHGIAKDHYAQTINYLAISNCQLGLIVNFGEDSLKDKKIN